MALHGRPQAQIDAGINLLAAAAGICPADALSFANKPTGYRLVLWNDSPDRTQADVLNLYDKAIELAVAEEMEGRRCC